MAAALPADVLLSYYICTYSKKSKDEDDDGDDDDDDDDDYSQISKISIPRTQTTKANNIRIKQSTIQQQQK